MSGPMNSVGKRQAGFGGQPANVMEKDGRIALAVASTVPAWPYFVLRAP